LIIFGVEAELDSVDMSDFPVANQVERAVKGDHFERPQGVVARAIRQESNCNFFAIRTCEHAIDYLVVGAVATTGNQQRILVKVHLLCKRVGVACFLSLHHSEGNFLLIEAVFNERNQVSFFAAVWIVDNADGLLVHQLARLYHLKFRKELVSQILTMSIL